MGQSLGLQAVLAKVESTYGTDPTPVPADDAVRITGFAWEGGSPEFAFPNLRDDVYTGQRFPQTPGTPAGKIMAFNFDVELRGAGAAYSSSVKPEVSPLLVACGFSETLDATASAESYTYDLADTGLGSCTIYVYEAGLVYKMVGCRGTMSWNLEAGTLARMHFEMQGILSATPAAASLPTATYDSTQSPAMVNVGLTISAWSSCAWANAVLDVANEVIRLDDGNASDAIEGFDLPKCNPTFKVDARVPDDVVTTYNPYTAVEAATSHTIDATVGSTQYNRIKIDVNDAALAGYPEHQNYQGLAEWGLTFNLNDLALVFD